MTTRERKKRRQETISEPESLSSLTEKRFSDLEALQLRQGQSVEELKGLILNVAQKLDAPRAMPVAQSPDAQIMAMRRAKNIGENVGMTKNVDLRNPGSGHKFEPGQIIRLAEASGKYPAYQFDAQGRPVPAIYQYECQACAHIEPALAGKKAKKVCPECRNTMLRVNTGSYEPGDRPAYGVIQNFMYKTKKGLEKYKVYFEQFSEREKSEGLLENEMVLCQ